MSRASEAWNTNTASVRLRGTVHCTTVRLARAGLWDILGASLCSCYSQTLER